MTVIKRSSTPHAALLQVCRYVGMDIPIDHRTTLNTKFGVIPSHPVGVDNNIRLSCFCIGNGAAASYVERGGARKSVTETHSREDMALFNHIPFVARRLDNDLSPTERKDYRLRTIREYDGNNYAVYWAKKISIGSDPVVMEYHDTDDNGDVSPREYIFSPERLDPLPTQSAENQISCATGTTLSITARARMNLSKWDMREIINACVVIYGDAAYANISEMCVCSGFDVEAEGVFTEGLLTDMYVESAYTQVTNHFTGRIYMIDSESEEINVDIKIGPDMVSIL